MKIFVNTRPLEFFGSQIDYEEVVKLAGKTGHPSVTYRGRSVSGHHREGLMHTGCKPVHLDEEMIFNVQHTGLA